MNSEKCEYIQDMKYKLITNEKLNIWLECNGEVY